MALVKSAAMAVAVIFGLTLAVFFWWEVAELIRRIGWSGLVEQRSGARFVSFGRMRNICGRRRAPCSFATRYGGTIEEIAFCQRFPT